MKIEPGMKVAIIGSRGYVKLHQVRAFVMGLPEGCIVLSGGARGVDQTAEQTARARGLDVISIPAQWDKFGKAAGVRRNQEIVAIAHTIIAFWDGISPGTAHSIQIARQQGKTVNIMG